MGTSKTKKNQRKEKPKKGGEEPDVSSEQQKYDLIRNLGLSVSGLKKEITELKKAIKTGKDSASDQRNILNNKMDSILNKWWEKRANFGIIFCEMGLEIF
jgi:predicted RNase H-like nuclease (RuvC/YqgF family)